MKKKKKKGGGAGVMLLDVATAMGVLAVVAGAQLASPLVDTLPKEAQGVAWMGFGGSLMNVRAQHVFRYGTRVRSEANGAGGVDLA